jgi:PAS domain S-box-containing protein/putative nucleotidyltransferase with HDIG domain
MIGYSPEEHYADPDLMFKLVHPDDLALFERVRAGGVRTGEAILMRWVHKDGRVIWVEQRTTNVYDPAGEIVAIEGIARDVTGQREIEAEMQRQLQRLASLRSIDQAISNSFDLNLVMMVLIDKVTSELKVDAASILLFNPINQMLEHSAGSGYRSRLVDSTVVRIGEAYAGLSMYERRMIQFPSPDLPAPSRDTARLMAEEGFSSGVCAPLITKGEVKGVLQVFSRTMIKPVASWLGFLEVLTSQAAIAIDNAELFRHLQRSNQDLKTAYDSMLEGLVRAMDARFHEAKNHSRSVTRLALELAETMHVSSEDLGNIRRGALLHDIGQLALPDAILLKPGPLTAEEWRIMRQHPRLALEMLSPITTLAKVMEIPYAHHEKWDGSGYPRGSKGEHIPFSARLFAVVDVWDSMTADRPYRPALSAIEAQTYIREQSGKHFDPDVVTAFLKKRADVVPG